MAQMHSSGRSRSVLLVAILLAIVVAAPAAAVERAPFLPGAPNCPMFPISNVWNKRVDGLAVRADSNTLLASIGLNSYLHPDFSSYVGGGYGIPYNVVGGGRKKKYVTFTYASESDRGPYPIPRRPKIEGGSDRHMLIVDRDNCVLYELYAAEWNDGDPQAGSGAIWDLGANRLRPDGWTSADAAGLPILPGLVRWDEVRSGAIRHAKYKERPGVRARRIKTIEADRRRQARDLEKTRAKLNALPAEKLHVVGPDADLWVHLGKKRRWMGGSGRNIPSFELFTSPDWRGTEGWVRFNQPLYRYGVLIEGGQLWFKNGHVVKATAKKNEKVLREMIATKNADRIGEYSLTDKRFSHITKFMAETLFDENIGGPNGNTHLALGNSYHDCFVDDPGEMSPEDWENLGYNDSSVHTDIISTAPRTVTAHLKNKKTKVIYKNGRFIL